jgi:hypothetical protein
MEFCVELNGLNWVAVHQVAFDFVRRLDLVLVLRITNTEWKTFQFLGVSHRDLLVIVRT